MGENEDLTMILRRALSNIDAHDRIERLRIYQSTRDSMVKVDESGDRSVEEVESRLAHLDQAIEAIEFEIQSELTQEAQLPSNQYESGKIKSLFVQFFESIRRPEILLPNLVAAAVLAVMNVTTAISVAALVFSGALAAYMSMGIGLYLVGTVVGGVLVAASSGYKAIIAGPRSGQAPIVASLAAGIVIAMQGQSDEAAAVTVVVGILGTTVFISVVLFAIGWAKLGGMVRYIPYPVMGGFFAGLGFLLFKGGILVSLGSIVSTNDLMSFLSVPALLHLAPAMAFAVILYVLDQRISHWMLMPCYLLATVALFYTVMFLTGSTVEMAAADLWLPAASSQDAKFFPVLTVDQLSLVDWSAILAQSSTILIMVLMSIIMLLLDTSGVEIVIDRDMDPNHELKAAGAANLINGLCTGVLCIQAAADTAFTYKLGGTRFIMILAYSLFVAAVIFVGPSPLAFVPTLMLGGLLIYIGISFLMNWVWQARKKLPLKDFLVVCVILFVVAAYGLLEGVAVGVVLAIVLFVHSYSQLSVIKSSLTGSEQVSNVDRNQRKTKYLDQNGDRMHIFVLQGFLFFGTASRLLEDIRALLEDPKRKELEFLLLDFSHVDAMDTSAANSFSKLIQICSKNNIVLAVTGCSTDISERLYVLVENETNPSEKMMFFNDLNVGVAWCHDRMLEQLDNIDAEYTPVEILSELLGDEGTAKAVASNFEQIQVEGGEALFSQGDPGNALYLIVQGNVSIVLDLPNGNKLNLRTMRAGAILGEMALYTGESRSASAKVNEDSMFLKLDAQSFRQMNLDQPAEASLFHTFIVRLMSERLGRANKTIMALSR